MFATSGTSNLPDGYIILEICHSGWSLWARFFKIVKNDKMTEILLLHYFVCEQNFDTFQFTDLTCHLQDTSLAFTVSAGLRNGSKCFVLFKKISLCLFALRNPRQLMTWWNNLEVHACKLNCGIFWWWTTWLCNSKMLLFHLFGWKYYFCQESIMVST